MAFKVAGLFVEALQRAQLFIAAELGLLNGRLQHANGQLLETNFTEINRRPLTICE
jgi:hypothetical protein